MPGIALAAQIATTPLERTQEDTDMAGQTIPMVEVEVFSDFCCPFCLIGNKHLDDAIAGLEGKVAVNTLHRAFELDPSAPDEGIDVRQALRDKHGVDASQVWPPLEARARESGIALDLARQPRAYPTLAAHTLVRHAAARGSARALSRAIGEAYFLDGEAISNHATLARIAAGHGFTTKEALALLADRAELARTRTEAEQSRARGVRSVPTVLIGGRTAISSSQPVADLQAAIAAKAVPA
jgi:predicted DsbA family dithiol-disulfide isomerase